MMKEVNPQITQITQMSKKICGICVICGLFSILEWPKVSVFRSIQVLINLYFMVNLLKWQNEKIVELRQRMGIGLCRRQLAKHTMKF